MQDDGFGYWPTAEEVAQVGEPLAVPDGGEESRAEEGHDDA